MRFLIDAQLPRRVALRLRVAGHDVLHTLDLPLRNQTPDSDIIKVAEQQDRIVVTKDADFVHSHVLQNRPQKLLLISTGNISNNDLDALLAGQMDALASLFKTYSFVELSRTSIVIHK